MPSGVYARTKRRGGWKLSDVTRERIGEASRRRNAVGSHTFGEWENLRKQYGNVCLMCGKSEPQIKLTEDHIIPLSKGGSDFIENIQPLCLSCNVRKHTKVINFGSKGDEQK